MCIVGAHSICARKAAACVRADMESAPTFLFSTNGRKLHNLYYLLFFISYLQKRRFSHEAARHRRIPCKRRASDFRPGGRHRADAKKGTIAYGILKAHNTGDSMQDLRMKFDSMTSHDITYVGIIQTARASGMTEFPLPTS